MALIDQIISGFEAIPIDRDGNLTLKSADFGIDFMDSFFTKVLREPAITLGMAAKTPGTGSIAIKGTADLYGYKQLTVTLSFALHDGEVVGRVTGTFDSSHTVMLPVISWIKVGNIGFSSTLSEKFEIVSFGFQADILPGEAARPIPIGIQSISDAEWQLDIGEGTEQEITGDQLVNLLGGHALASFLPLPLVSALDGFQINGIQTIFDIAQKRVSYFSTGISVTNGWEIAPKVSLKPGLQINLTLIDPTDPATRLTVGNIAGTFDINGVELPILIGSSFGSETLWSIGFQPGKSVTLPSFSDLLGLAGGQDFLNSLPGGLSHIPQVRINELLVEFDPGKKGLTRLAFYLETTSTWPVIPGYFAIDRLATDFDITNLIPGASPVIVGTVTGLFNIKEVYLMCSIRKTEQDTNWTIIGGLPPDKTISLTKVAAQLFEGKVTMPANVPDFAFSTLTITVVPATKSFSFEAQSANAWPVTDKISVESFHLIFSRNPADTAAPIQGNVATRLRISTVEITLGAALHNMPGGGWQFEGGTAKDQKIPIGDLIQDLAKRFGTDAELPEPVKKLEIKTLFTSFNTGSKDFTFNLDMDFPIKGKTVDLKVAVQLKNYQNTYQKDFSGAVSIADLLFALKFSQNNTENIFLASYQNLGGGALAIGKLLNSLTEEKLVADDAWSLTIKEALFAYHGQVAEAGKQATGEGGEPAAGANPNAGFILGLDLDTGIDLSGLPLIGKLFTKDQTLRVVFTPVIASADFKEPDLKSIRSLAPSGTTVLPPAPADANDQTVILKKGPNLAITLRLGTENIHLSLPVSFNDRTGNVEQSSGASNSITPTATAPQQADDGTKWFALQKNFGPVQFKRLGMRFKDSRLAFLIDASLAVGPLSLSLSGLGVSTPLSPILPAFELKGLGVDFKSGPLEIAGAFLRQRITPAQGDPYDEYDGIVLIKAEAFTLSAIGSYAYFNGHPSLFIYAVLDYPIGGPAFFFVNGLAAGFGYNRSLLMPDISAVASFPLVAQVTQGSAPAPPGQTSEAIATQITDELTKLRQFIPPTVGQYFLAVGLRFSSFELIDSFVLLAVSFGKRFEIDVLGLSTAVIPTPEAGNSVPALAEVQLALKAVFLPEEGFLGVQAQLTSASYLLARDCHLTGGFAFFVWFKDQENPAIPAGEFVLSIGGYHPKFPVPAYYPSVPRAGFNWKVSEELSIRGGSYFALTPHVIMAGTQLEATWESGALRAWFKAGADFIVYWKPYHYDAEVYVDFGISYTFHFFGTHHITADASADLHIWGPEFSGQARVHLWIVSFTVHFGANSATSPKPIDWPTFKESFLPRKQSNPTLLDAYSLSLTNGLVEMVQDGSPGQSLWLINPKEMAITFDSAIPLTSPPAGMAPITLPEIGIAPMDTTEFNSTVTVSITKDGKDLSGEFAVSHPIRKNMPAGLWGPKLSNDLNGKKFVENALTGFEIRPAQPVLESYTNPIDPANFSFSTDGIDGAYQWEPAFAFTTDETKGRAALEASLMNADVALQRNALLEALGYAQPNNEIMTQSALDTIFLEVPQIGVVG